MKTQWTQLPGQDGIQRYKANRGNTQAWVKRNEDGSAESGSKSGPFGLGLQTESFHFSPAPSDAELLGRIDRSVNPPRYDNWEAQEKSSPNTNYYQGEADNFFNSTVKASITRVGDEASVKAKVGLFGTEIEGHFFAPAPSDAEILRRISER